MYAFIVDSGIRATHTEFAGRVLTGINYVADANGTNDCHGHGTHVSGIVGGKTWGVAKDVTLVPVRVLDCNASGSTSNMIAGINWVAGQTALRPAVLNMSLGMASKSTTLNAAAAGAYNAGVTVVTAAGNSKTDACTFSPASEPTALTVAASTSGDAQDTSYSNYGSCVDLYAPGSNITSAWHTSDSATAALNGTSMAAPHVAGVAALAWAANGNTTPAEVSKFILSNATPNKLVNLGAGSPNLLVYSMAAGTPATPPTANVSVKSITARTTLTKTSWTAYATIAVRDAAGNAVPNATVTGTFTPGGDKSCVTGSTGSCELGNTAQSTKVTSVSIAVKNISGRFMAYQPSQNVYTSLTIAKP